MLKPANHQASFYGSYLYERIIPQNHLLRKIGQTVDFSFIRDLLKDKYTPDFGHPKSGDIIPIIRVESRQS